MIGENFEREVLESDETVIVEFYRPNCGSCSTLSFGYE